jgi:ketosteroid isomerase-like protein
MNPEQVLPGNPDDPTDPIAGAHRRFIDAVLSADVPGLVSLYSQSAVLMPPNDTTLYGVSELEEWHQEYFANFRVVTLEAVERDVSVMGVWAVERWTYLVAIQPVAGGERIRDDGRSLTVWTKEAGQWRISQSMFNSIRPIGSGTIRFLALLKKKADDASSTQRAPLS